jgi:hypothetical protein
MRGKLYFTLGIIAVSMLWLASAAANYSAGLSMAGPESPYQAHVFGAISAACDVLKAVALFAIISAIALYRPGVAALGVVIFALCATWSLRSATMFAWGHLGDAQLERVRDGKILDARMTVLDQDTKRLGWLREQSVSKDNKRGDRRNFAEEYSTNRDELLALTTDLEKQRAVTPGDPIGQVLGLDDRIVTLITGGFLAILLEVVSSTGFVMLSLSRGVTAQRAVVDVPIPQHISVPSSPLEQAAPVPAPPVVATHPAIRSKQIETALSRVALRDGSGSIRAGELRDAVNAALPASVKPVTPNELFDHLERRGFQRKKRNGYMVYSGLRVA